MAKKILEGIRVIDFTWVATGPLTTRFLADYGAEVIKIEGASRPDTLRTGGIAKDDIPGVNRVGSFYQYNIGKLDLTLNITHPKAVGIVKKLVATGDVVVDNYAAGQMQKFGLGYEELKKVKPDIIVLSSSVQGQTGPYARTRGWGTTTSALCGICQIAGWPDREAAMLGVYTDYIAFRYCTLSILAALEYRRRTGKGMFIDHSQCETGMHFMAPLILDYAANKRIAARMGNRSTYAAPHGVYRCLGGDRWCAITVFTDEEWRSFCNVIGNPAWTKETKFGTVLGRKKNEDELDRLIEAWTVNHTAEEVMTTMQAAGVPAGLAETGEDVVEHDPQVKHRQFIKEIEGPEIGKYHVCAPCFTMSKASYELKRGPLLGEHNEYVLKNILGMSDDEIVELVLEGVFN